MTANTMTGVASPTAPDTFCPLCSAYVNARTMILTGMYGLMCRACWDSYRQYQDRNQDIETQINGSHVR